MSSLSSDRQIGLAVRRLLQLSPEVHAALARRMEVGGTDLQALDLLSSQDAAMGVVELGRRLGVTSASATVLVDRLVAAGHLRRSPHPTDRRRVTLELTESAVEEVRMSLHPLLVGLSGLTESLDGDGKAQVLRFLTGLGDVLTRFARPEH